MNEELNRQTANTGDAVSENATACSLRIPHLLTLPKEQIEEILNRHAERIPTCELCGKRFNHTKSWMTGAWQVDAYHNPNTLYIYRMHLRCFKQARSDPAQRALLAIEARATREFTEHLRAMPTAGGVQ